MTEAFNAISIEPDSGTRNRLKQATQSVALFRRIYQVSTHGEALARLEISDQVDVIFISYRLDPTETTEFIKTAKTTKQGQDAAYVLVQKANSQNVAVAAVNIINGSDGLLFEPYSVDSLVEITTLASRVKRERRAAREEAAMRFLIGEIIQQISLIAYVHSSGGEKGRHMRKLRQLTEVFETLDAEAKNAYLLMAVDLFEKAPLLEHPTNHYGGASSRIRRRLEDKVLAKLQAAQSGASS